MSDSPEKQHASRNDAPEAESPSQMGRSAAPPAFQLMASREGGQGPIQRRVDPNPRFDQNTDLQEASDNTDTLQLGDTGMGVRILQQGLIDAGFDITTGVTGTFDAATETAVKAFQASQRIRQDGVVGPRTMRKLHTLHNRHRSVAAIAQGTDPANPLAGTRSLNADEIAAVTTARSTAPVTSTGLPRTFVDPVGGQSFSSRVTRRMQDTIDWMYRDAQHNETRRSDPANLHDESSIEDVADVAKEKVDAMYGAFYSAASKPAFRFGTNLFDAWENEGDAMSADPAYADFIVRDLSGYFVNNYMSDILEMHGADPDRAAERAIIDPIRRNVETTQRDKFILIQQNWPGLADNGEVSIQLNRSDSRRRNKDFMWNTFGTLIHEYIHTLEDPAHETYRQGLDENGGGLTYREGMTDYFTKIVWENLAFDATLRSRVEGPFHQRGVRHSIPRNGYYDSVEQAERVVGIVGVRNAMGAFFQGQINLIGG